MKAHGYTLVSFNDNWTDEIVFELRDPEGRLVAKESIEPATILFGLKGVNCYLQHILVALRSLARQSGLSVDALTPMLVRSDEVVNLLRPFAAVPPKPKPRAPEPEPQPEPPKAKPPCRWLKAIYYSLFPKDPVPKATMDND